MRLIVSPAGTKISEPWDRGTRTYSHSASVRLFPQSLARRVPPGTFQTGHKGNPMAAKRTTLRSSSGKKLYAARAADGTFKDIQSYKRAQGQDIKRKSKVETAKKKK
jgi:hypothetical protein